MKMVMITYNEAVDEEVMEVLKKASVVSYTKLLESYGKGKSSGTHLGTDIWPGRNSVLLIACKEEKARGLMDGVKALRKELAHLGVKAFSWTIDEIVE